MADFGADLSWGLDLDPAGRMATGRTLLLQALVRRLVTPRGTLFTDEDYGFDLRGMLGDDDTRASTFALAAGVERECLRDERVRSAAVSVTRIGDRIDVVVELEDDDGPFELTLAVDQLTVQVLTPFR